MMSQDLEAALVDDDRAMKPAMRNGWRQRCPHCGTGRLFGGFLKVRDQCATCGEVLSHQRADDGPAYATILIVGHVMAPLFLWTYFRWQPDPLVMCAVFGIGTVALSLYLLPRLKGVFVAIQWAKRMHGFGRSSPAA
jgi:uncharacterized protein (DUF983 family)